MNDALTRLIGAVETGGDAIAIEMHAIHAGLPCPGSRFRDSACLRAYQGSLDAAKELHDALLPSWIFDVTNGSAFVMRDLPDADLTHDMCPQYLGEADSPARAWLLAILRAKLAENHPRQETSD